MKNHISYSQIQLFKNCSARWDFQYNQFPDRKEDAWHLTTGSAYHHAVEDFYNGLGFDKGMETFMSHFDKNNLRIWQVEELETLIKNLEFYYNGIYPQYKGIVKTVEISEDFYIDGIDIPMTTRIDLLTIDDRIIDHKTVGNSDPDVDANKQLLIYSYWFYNKYRRMPSKVELHKSYKQEWRDHQRVEVSSIEPDKTQMFKVIEEVRHIYKLMKAEMYAPSISGLCKYCPFQDECDKAYGKKI
jgi:CRISPR/Cas system-associated exonuclease Cas4 (RecB family)